MNLLSLLSKSLLSDAVLTALAKKTGLKTGSLKKLIPLAVPLLLKALTKNASSQSGVQSLLGALSQHRSTKSVEQQIGEADVVDGSKILGHIFGDETDSAVRGLAVQSGLEDQEVKSVLSSLTPALLSGLSAATGSGKAKLDLSDGIGMDDVMAIFGGQASGASLLGGQASGGLFGGQASGGLLGSLLGGSSPAGGLLGGLLGGNQEDEEQDDGVNGTSLLNMLLSAMR